MTATCRTSKVPKPQSDRRLNGFEASAGPPPDVVALRESPSSRTFEKVYTPRNVKPALKRRFTSTCSALYELSPLENHVQVFLGGGLVLVVDETKYEPVGTGWPARPGGNPG